MNPENESNRSFLRALFWCLVVVGLFVSAHLTPLLAQGSDKECQTLMKQIDDLVDRVAEASKRMGSVEGQLKSPYASAETLNSLQNTLKKDESTIRSLKATIGKLLEKLCACCGKRSEQTGKSQPTPTPGQATSDTLKKVFQSVHISIGGGYTSGHEEHHHGEDRHRTADKVSTDKTKTHTTSPTTTHKTVTSACKCHPCTCSPCHCH